jgi:hypothetical protein
MHGSALEKVSLTLHSHLYIIRDQLQGIQNCIIPAQSIKRGIARCTIINTGHRQQQSWSRESVIYLNMPKRKVKRAVAINPSRRP